MNYLEEISQALQKGRTKLVKALIPEALENGLSPHEIVNDGLLHGISIVSEKFKLDEVFVPEVLIAAHVMKAGLNELKPYLDREPAQIHGTVVIGTVQGDLHDIGKNMVGMLMECRGLQVIDLGVDVPAQRFVEAAIESRCDIVACSALLTTTMDAISQVIQALKDANIRSKVKVMVGGAPVSQAFCDAIGADVYTADAASAADKALELVRAK